MNNADSLILKTTEGFFQNALENNQIIKFQENLKFLLWNLERTPSYYDLLNSPFVEIKDKYESLEDTFKDVLIPEVLLFAKILIEKNIFNHLKEVKETFDQLVDQEQNILDGFIYTPFELSETQISKIQAAFENKFNAKCNFKIVIDKDLIAGIRVLINETIFEYSVESKLDNIKENLNQYYDNYFKNNKEGK